MSLGLLPSLKTLGAGLGCGGILLLAACDPSPKAERCGPTQALVTRVIDGDTIELENGERVRYLLIDTPESTQNKNECWGEEAALYNRQLVEGETVNLEYDQECSDNYGRLLAYVSLEGSDINALLLERGYACLLHIPPNGNERVDEYQALETTAQTKEFGMWGQCYPVEC